MTAPECTCRVKTQGFMVHEVGCPLGASSSPKSLLEEFRLPTTQLCARSNCGAKAEWQPILVLRAPTEQYPDAPVVPSILKIGICHLHRLEARLEDLLSDQGWAETTLDWRRIE